jgi:hypothetical protein
MARYIIILVGVFVAVRLGDHLAYLWLRSRLPEIGLLGSREMQRREIDSAMSPLARAALWLIIVAVCAALALRLSASHRSASPQAAFYWFAASWSLAFLPAKAILCWLFRERIAATIRRTLNSNGVVVCMSCGYRLIGVNEACTECGAKTI